MFKPVIVASLFLLTGTIASQARPVRTVTSRIPECNVTMPCDFSFAQASRQRSSRYTERSQSLQHGNVASVRNAYASANVADDQIVGGRPAGCPRAFCGCGASLHVFGRVVPELNLAANWLRFPRTSPAPGMVAARRGHVFVLEQSLGGDMWMAYDANSGGRATRIHARSLRGYTIVNPHAG
jgi:hypothetical protein